MEPHEPAASEGSAIPAQGAAGGWRAVAFAAALWYFTSLVVLLGTTLGMELLRPANPAEDVEVARGELLFRSDPQRFRLIAAEGYPAEISERSPVAFFPAYPLLGRGVAWLTGSSIDAALIVTANAALVAAMIVFACYARLRSFEVAGKAPTAESRDAADYALLALGLFPTGMFFRLPFTESLFLALAVLGMYALLRDWPLWLAASIIGAATAARPVGVALLFSLALHVWDASPRWTGRLLRAAVLLPLGGWGLAAFMAFQYATYGDPFAFVDAHEEYRHRDPIPWHEEALGLLTLEPIRAVYDPESDVYWENMEPRVPPIFNLMFANPLYFLSAVGLTLLGWRKGWLNRDELALAAGLLFIPYVARAYDMGMGAFGRFSAVVFPIYLVLGQLMARLPAAAAAALFALMAFLMGAYAALLAAGYLIY